VGALNTVIVAPLTSTIRDYPIRIDCIVAGVSGQVAVDQLRAIDKIRLTRKIGSLDTKKSQVVLNILQDLFS
jgi:mRNA interferase MazF